MKKTAYRLTAAIGDLKRGAVIELDEQKAASPLYASRITPVETLEGLTVTVDVEAIRAEVLEDLKAEAEKIVSDAQAEAKKIIEAAQAEAEKIVSDAQAEAKKIIEAAQAEAMKLAASTGKK